MAIDLITTAEYKAYAGITSTSQDTVIAAIIPKVSALVKAICRRTFVDYVFVNKVEYFQEGTNTYIPKESPILTVFSLEYSSDYGVTYEALLPNVNYVWNKQEDVINCLGTETFSTLINAYRLTYTAGYIALPEDLKLAVCDLITYYLRNDSAVHSNKAPGTNTVQVEYITTTGLPAHIRRVLDLYTHSYA